jgi:putative CRISPR-associated protein (TIGR02620 family)
MKECDACKGSRICVFCGGAGYDCHSCGGTGVCSHCPTDSQTVIVSRHTGAVEWLAQRGITGEVIAQATPEDVRGKNVIGNLPMHLASLAAKVGSIDLPRLAAADRGRDLTPEEMDAAGATIRWYVVAAVDAADA